MIVDKQSYKYNLSNQQKSNLMQFVYIENKLENEKLADHYIIKQLDRYTNLEEFRFESTQSRLNPSINLQLTKLNNLKVFHIKERVNAEYPGKDRDLFCKNSNQISIILNFVDPSKLKFILDYEYHNFNFEHLKEVAYKNGLSVLEARINTLYKTTSYIKEPKMFHDLCSHQSNTQFSSKKFDCMDNGVVTIQKYEKDQKINFTYKNKNGKIISVICNNIIVESKIEVMDIESKP